MCFQQKELYQKYFYFLKFVIRIVECFTPLSSNYGVVLINSGGLRITKAENLKTILGFHVKGITK